MRLDVVSADATVGNVSTLWSDNGLEVSAMGVPHGKVPSLAYRVRVGNRGIVFGSDQTASDERFTGFAAGADALVMHFGLSARAREPLALLHARPAAVGQVARKAKVKRLVLSHFMHAPPMARTPEWFSLFDLGEAVGEVRKHYSGRIDTAVDLQCIPVR